MQLPQKIFTVQDEPPSWDDDDDTGLESVSEPDMDDLDDEAVVDENELSGDFAQTALDDVGDVSATTIQPVDIAKKKTVRARQAWRAEEQDEGTGEEEWTEELAGTPGQGRSVENWEGVHSRRPPPVPLGREGRGETESWIRPSKEVKAAPNGGNVL